MTTSPPTPTPISLEDARAWLSGFPVKPRDLKRNWGWYDVDMRAFILESLRDRPAPAVAETGERERLISALGRVASSIRAYDDRIKDHDADLAERDAKTVEAAIALLRAPLSPKLREAMRDERVCEWSRIEPDCDVFNTCKEYDEFHLTEGLDLWPHCHWCGGKIEVIDSHAADAGEPK